MESRSEPAIIEFDGDCGLCQRAIEWVRQRDRRQRFVYRPLDRDSGSVILRAGGREFTKSEAVIRILTMLGGAYRFAALFRVVPPSVRDATYRWIARNRRQWFPPACQKP